MAEPIDLEELRKVARQAKKTQMAFAFTPHYSDAEAERDKRKTPWGWPRISPDSVLVCGIGTNWARGAWEKVTNMVQFARRHTVQVWLHELRDPCMTLPYMYIGTMRDRAVLSAQSAGAEWVCLVENDALPEQDLLLNLVSRQCPVIGPRVVYKGPPEMVVGYPRWDANEGIKPVRWLPFTFLLMKTAVFNCFDPFVFANTYSEGHFFHALTRYGHQGVQDTDHELVIATPPSGKFNSLQEYHERIRRADKRRREAPDRRPLDPNTPTIEGVYFPWWTDEAAQAMEGPQVESDT